ncbi:NAD-dependent epimerase/dehydratase family protein [Rubrobacter radiotolerans]|nr:NAD-dependent epimerase/dehydratase family protein [Rubrobacter radiotolerans]MDX5893193.1 NAD-dependent epimerase/dehydratase family protein [Rubrobacter radiotolerans]
MLYALLMNWLVTGGCGFLGSSFIGRLVREGGHSVRAVDDLSVGTREDLAAVTEFREAEPEGLGEMSREPGAVELVVGSILNEGLALRAAAGADVIVHFAANTGVAPSVEDPRADCYSNVIGTLNYLEAARASGVGRFVFASSGAAVGEVEPPLHEELAPHPVSPYGASKLAGEAYCSAYNGAFGVETVALRFGNVYGPGSGHKNSAVAKFIKRASRGEVLEVYGDGTQTRDFIYVHDLTRAVYRAATVAGLGGEVFQIATNAETSVSELIVALTEALRKVGIEDVEVRQAAPRRGDVRRNYSDTSKARELLGWTPEVTLPEGLDRTVEWFLHED